MMVFVVLRMKSPSVTNQMKATELYFPMVLFNMLNKVALTFGVCQGNP